MTNYWALIMLIMASTVNAEVSSKPPSVSLAGFMLGKVISIPFEYKNYQARSQVSEALSLASGQKASVAEYYSAERECPDNTSVDLAKTNAIAKPTDIYGRYTEQVVVKENNGKCTITASLRKQGVAPEIAGKTLTLTMTATSYAFAWSCHADMDNHYLPISCRQ